MEQMVKSIRKSSTFKPDGMKVVKSEIGKCFPDANCCNDNCKGMVEFFVTCSHKMKHDHKLSTWKVVFYADGATCAYFERYDD